MGENKWNFIGTLFVFCFVSFFSTQGKLREKKSLKAVDTTLNRRKCLGKEKEKEATFLPTQRWFTIYDIGSKYVCGCVRD